VEIFGEYDVVVVGGETSSIDDLDSHVSFFCPSLLSGHELPGGFTQDFKTTQGDAVGCHFCYRSSVSDTSKKRGFEFHIFTWDT
jgi:hypothetical protein